MLWTFLRIGWGNTTTIFALGVLPIVVLADVAFDQRWLRQDQAVLENTIVDKTAVVTASALLD